MFQTGTETSKFWKRASRYIRSSGASVPCSHIPVTRCGCLAYAVPGSGSTWMSVILAAASARKASASSRLASVCATALRYSAHRLNRSAAGLLVFLEVANSSSSPASLFAYLIFVRRLIRSPRPTLASSCPICLTSAPCVAHLRGSVEDARTLFEHDDLPSQYGQLGAGEQREGSRGRSLRSLAPELSLSYRFRSVNEGIHATGPAA